MTDEVRGARNLREVDEAYELASKVFGPNYFEAREIKAHTRALEPLRSLEDAVVVVSGEEIVGFVRIVDRQFYSPAGILKAGGITSVCIHPEWRGQGWGIRVTEAALQRSEQRGDAFSILFARRAVDGWYPKFGYVGIGCHLEMRIEKPFVGGALLPSFTGSTQGGIVESYLDTYADAYTDSYQDLFLSFCRDKDWWQNLEQRLARRVDPKDFINVMVGGSPIGYFMLKEGRVIEAASLRQHRADFVAGLVEFCIASNSERLILALPSSHWCVELLRGMNHTLSVRYSWDGGHMVRILNKGVFKEIVMRSVGREFREAIDRLFKQYSVSEHESARRLLLALVGAWATTGNADASADLVGIGTDLLPMLPAWSIIDEL